MVAACLDLVGSIAELLLTLWPSIKARTESWRSFSTDEILVQSYCFAGRNALARQSICG